MNSAVTDDKGRQKAKTPLRQRRLTGASAAAAQLQAIFELILGNCGNRREWLRAARDTYSENTEITLTQNLAFKRD